MASPNNPPKDPRPIREVAKNWPTILRPRNEDGKALTGSELNQLKEGLEDQFRRMSLSDNQAARESSGNSALPAPVSISIGKADIMSEDQMEDLGYSIGFAQEVLNSIELTHVDDLDDARGALLELSEKTEALTEYKRDHSYGRYQVVSFSKLTTQHLVDMGVTSKYLSKDKRDGTFQALDFTPSFKKSGQMNRHFLSVIFGRFWKKLMDGERFIKDFKLLKKSIGRKPEARARMLTDYILAQLMVFVEEELDLVQFMFLELVLSSSREPVSIIHENTATLLTGSVDYAILSSVQTTTAVARSLGVKNDDIYNLIGDASKGNNFEDIKHSRIWPMIREEFNRFKFTLIEEKRKDLGKKQLKDCEPQVTGEALVLQNKVEKDGILWCLSNGEEWIFGGLNKKQSRSFPPMSIDDKNLEASIQAILKMLVIWTVGSERDLKEYLGM